MRLPVRLLLAALLLTGVVYAGAWATVDRYGASRAIAWLGADTGDVERFPSRAVPRGGPVLELPPGPTLDLAAAWDVDDADALLEQTQTAAFLVVHDGRLRYEHYLGDNGPEVLRTSFSVAKSVVSTLIGLAIDDGAIQSLDEPITDFVPELLDRDARFADITVRDLLTMSSGLSYVERSLPWSDDAQTYYGTDLRATALSARVDHRPGEQFLYNNYNLLLEGLVLERATGAPVAEYLSARLWGPMGAEADATWSLDSDRSGFEKMESGLNAVARDYARFGLLFANGGRVGDRQVVPPAWVELATSRGEETRPHPGYGLHWWTGDFAGTALPDGHAMAAGNFGQFVYVAPDAAVVVVRLGDDHGTDDWPARFAQIVEHVRTDAA
ncbi:serine hydrolase domain-containing protein [Egicoccus sp. AB-alg2]|uniref:serine hydrolase domain-containing protein n=1 Tax=Egicoccus sp. AB-alg2 TaxID=3242693 RepID=UPI00359E8031